jgi:D-aminoacyl-tRNA deacylase
MRVVIQRVSEASVKIEGNIKSSIKGGLLVLLGVEEADTKEDIEWLCGKITRLRIFNDSEGVMNLSVAEVNGDILLISQFTLFASTKKGNRPSYIKSAKPEVAIPLYEKFIQVLEKEMNPAGQSSNGVNKRIFTGEFGADMKVSLINNGPVTIIIDSKNRE